MCVAADVETLPIFIRHRCTRMPWSQVVGNLRWNKCHMDQQGEQGSFVKAFSVFHLDVSLFLAGILAAPVGIR